MKGLDGNSTTVGRRASVWFICLGLAVVSSPPTMARQWTSYGRDAQHTALAAGPSQLPAVIRWSTPVDLMPQYSGNGDLYIHYGSPAITAANTILVPVKTQAAGSFEVNGINARTGNQLWTLATDYALPPNANWTPPLGITLTPSDAAVAIPAAGGTVLVRKNPNSPQGPVSRIAFFGIKNYNMNKGAFNSAIQICTPITCDGFGNLYFGYVSSGAALPGYPQGIPSGLARVTSGGTGLFVAAHTLCNDGNIRKVVYNCAPALSSDGTKLYVAVNQSSWSYGYLCLVESQTLTARRSILLTDPHENSAADLPDEGTAAPTIGPDGDVYFGVLEANFPSNHDRGWLLHFNAGLTTTKIPGAFGWDDSASIVPRALVPSYKGHSTYLVLTKYNNYADAGIGGNGMNKVAVLDPNTSMSDPITGATVMNEVLTILGPTQNPNLPGVNEWCINSAAIDTANKCAVVNSEDGHVYRWDFTTNTLSAGLYLAPPTGEAYTSTLIGPDGAVYAINNARLFCCVASNPNMITPPNTPFLRSSFFKGRSRFFPAGLQGAAWIGILAAFSVHLGIRASSRMRTVLGSFLS
ncbi:MAG: hypothetical protein ACHRXM_38065 [Isosphaerales bacterium]